MAAHPPLPVLAAYRVPALHEAPLCCPAALHAPDSCAPPPHAWPQPPASPDVHPQAARAPARSCCSRPACPLPESAARPPSAQTSAASCPAAPSPGSAATPPPRSRAAPLPAPHLLQSGGLPDRHPPPSTSPLHLLHHP